MINTSSYISLIEMRMLIVVTLGSPTYMCESLRVWAWISQEPHWAQFRVFSNSVRVLVTKLTVCRPGLAVVACAGLVHKDQILEQLRGAKWFVISWRCPEVDKNQATKLRIRIPPRRELMTEVWMGQMEKNWWMTKQTGVIITQEQPKHNELQAHRVSTTNTLPSVW